MTDSAVYSGGDDARDPLLSSAGAYVAPDQRPLNIRLGARLFTAADSFVFLAFLFAYFYLRSINAHGMWRPPHTNPSLTLGVVTLAVVTASTAAVLFARARLRAGDAGGFVAFALLGLALCIAAIIAQVLQLVNPGFSPSGAGGYGSVFIGFTGVFVVHLFGALYWLASAVTGVRRPDPASSGAPLAGVSAYCTFALFLAGVEIAAFVLIYLV
jgi:heme/copper-type cytochrome/quinol oxidase subunit 3